MKRNVQALETNHVLSHKELNCLYIKLKEDRYLALFNVSGQFVRHHFQKKNERIRHASVGTNRCLARVCKLKSDEQDLFFDFLPQDVIFISQ